MCHERWWLDRRARQDEESREIWRDFEQTTAGGEPAPDAEPEVTRLDAADPVAAAER